MFLNKIAKNSNNSGQALIEMILAVAVAATFLTGLVMTSIIVREAFARSEKLIEANLILQKEADVVRQIREVSWNSLAVLANTGSHHTERFGDSWRVSPTTGAITENGFTRSFAVEGVCRWYMNAPIQLPSSCTPPSFALPSDPSAKKVVVTVSWNSLGTQSISTTFFIGRYFGNSNWIQTLKADFDQGSFNNTRSTSTGDGDVQLITSGGSSFTDDYDNSTDYNYDTNKIEVVGGFAQLKAQGSVVSGGTINSGFNSSSAGWSWSSWGQNINQGNSYRSTGGNPGGYIESRAITYSNRSGGSYWSQPFTTTTSNPTAIVKLDWKIFAYQPPARSFSIYVFVDTNNSNPSLGQEVWSQNITGTTNWNSVINIDASSKVNSAGTYYLKIAMYVDRPRGQYYVGFDNVSLNWSKTIGSYPTDSPTISRKISFNSTSITRWNSFSATTVLNGGQMRFQLSDNNGITWQYYNGSAWVNATLPTQYNDEITINSNIRNFSTVNNQINIRAFLISNGSQQVRLDTIVIGYNGAETGTFTSSSFISMATVGFNKIFWTENGTINTTIKLQIATNNDNLTWNFVGPNGSNSTYFTGGEGTIPINTISGRFLRYQIFFSSNNNDIPSVTDVTINYSP